jgi:hypothetical protein
VAIPDVLVRSLLEISRRLEDTELQLLPLIRTAAEEEAMLPTDAPEPHPTETTKLRELKMQRPRSAKSMQN